MPIKKLVLALLLCMSPLATGCAAALEAIPVIASVVTDAAQVLSVIDLAVQEFFRTHPDTPASVRARYTDAMTKAHRALNASQKALRGVQDIDQKQYDAAFVEFREAYKDLVAVLTDEGLMNGSKLSAGIDSTVEIPEPEALTLRVAQ